MPEADTSQRILDAAEELFVEQGFGATTLRQITARAGVNLAAVNYHFGSKHALIEEMFRRRLGWLNEQRLRELDRLESGAKSSRAPLRPSQILEAFFGVALRMAFDREGGGGRFMRLLGRTYTEPTEYIRVFLAEEYSEAIPRFKKALFKSLPGVPKEEILWRFHFMLGALSYAISGADALRILGGIEDDGEEALHARLMSFLIGGLRAPLPELQEAKHRGRTRVAARRNHHR